VYLVQVEKSYAHLPAIHIKRIDGSGGVEWNSTHWLLPSLWAMHHASGRDGWSGLQLSCSFECNGSPSGKEKKRKYVICIAPNPQEARRRQRILGFLKIIHSLDCTRCSHVEPVQVYSMSIRTTNILLTFCYGLCLIQFIN